MRLRQSQSVAAELLQYHLLVLVLVQRGLCRSEPVPISINENHMETKMENGNWVSVAVIWGVNELQSE